MKVHTGLQGALITFNLVSHLLPVQYPWLCSSLWRAKCNAHTTEMSWYGRKITGWSRRLLWSQAVKDKEKRRKYKDTTKEQLSYYRHCPLSLTDKQHSHKESPQYYQKYQAVRERLSQLTKIRSLTLNMIISGTISETLSLEWNSVWYELCYSQLKYKQMKAH